ncbi:hypothetical protein [Caloramator sp. Dgby_cultured_2]|nr:hypothetical protein [Caloramator sp. Dgby_cultured_2]WDU82251.1 hypothetical protein PWK10_11130 [Caloramator sp. Dgby_cultured_2]
MKKEVKTFYCNVAGIEVGLFDFVFKMGMKKRGLQKLMVMIGM